MTLSTTSNQIYFPIPLSKSVPTLSLNQCITFPTNITGHLLDHIFCRYYSSCQCITDYCKSDLITDHFLITCRLVFPYSISIEKNPLPAEITDKLTMIARTHNLY